MMPPEHSKMIEFMPRIFSLICPTNAGSGDVFPALTPLVDLEIFCHGFGKKPKCLSLLPHLKHMPYVQKTF